MQVLLRADRVGSGECELRACVASTEAVELQQPRR
jgi:hypothetical protein